MYSKCAFITGAAGGLGKATAELLAEKDWHVFAADTNKQGLSAFAGNENITTMQIDVTDSDSIDDALKEVERHTDGLDALLNFAGILTVGSLIEVDEAELYLTLNVNVMGTFRVNRAFFPLIKARRGRIANMSSETGKLAGMPFNGAYGMSKHAIECYSDALRRELGGFGIKVIKIQPGPFKTSMTGGIKKLFQTADENSTHFKGKLARMGKIASKESHKGHPPEVLATTVYHALTVEQPKAAYSVRPDPLRALLNLLPSRWADHLFGKLLRS